MKPAIVVGLIGSMVHVSLGFAADFPDRHAEICVSRQIGGKTVSVVSKEKLATFLLKTNPAATSLYAFVETVNPTFAPKWRAIFRDKDFCATSPACLAPAAKKPDLDPTDTSKINRQPPPGVKPAPGQLALDNLAARQTLRDLRETLAESILLATAQTGRYSAADTMMGGSYFDSTDDTVKPIFCVGKDLEPAPDPVVIATPFKDRLRLRANSDDLRVKASDDKDKFKALNPATISYTTDNVAGTRVAKAQAALGYAFQLPFNDYLPKGYSFFDGELIPYISAQENLTKKNGTLATHADADNVAVGTVLKLDTQLDAVPGLLNTISAQPQYLWNTKDKSEIASFRFIYQPFFVRSGEANINVANGLAQWFGGALGASTLTLIFDLRNDVGEYTKRAADPVAALAQNSFDRAGSNFGFALSTDASKAHVVLRVTETLLYGFQGSVRWLDYFDSSLTFYLDSTSNFGFNLAYTKGADENTAQRAQTYKAGFAVKF